MYVQSIEGKDTASYKSSLETQDTVLFTFQLSVNYFIHGVYALLSAP